MFSYSYTKQSLALLIPLFCMTKSFTLFPFLLSFVADNNVSVKIKLSTVSSGFVLYFRDTPFRSPRGTELREIAA